MQFELISFKLCPFVQRAVIVLRHKNIEFAITHIDLANPPDWFKEISPLGKVPILKVDGEVLFESAVINEFLDEVTPGSMLAEEPFDRARQRAWTELASTLNENVYHLTGAKDFAEYNKQVNEIQNKLESLAKIIDDKKWFNGESLSLTDCAFAPFFMRAKILTEFSVDLTGQNPKLQNWVDNLLGLDAVKSSVVPEFKDLFINMGKKRSKYLADQIS